MLDLFIGDWDRHSDQWKWAGFKSEGKTLWLPVPVYDQQKYNLTIRDAGREIGFRPSVDYSADTGVFLGMGATLVNYEFKTTPYRYWTQLSGGAAFCDVLRYKSNYTVDFQEHITSC